MSNSIWVVQLVTSQFYCLDTACVVEDVAVLRCDLPQHGIGRFTGSAANQRFIAPKIAPASTSTSTSMMGSKATCRDSEIRASALRQPSQPWHRSLVMLLGHWEVRRLCRSAQRALVERQCGCTLSYRFRSPSVSPTGRQSIPQGSQPPSSHQT